MTTLDWQGFRVPSQDHHGHSVRLWFRLQPGHDQQLRNIIGSKLWPYRDHGDVLRHALQRHMQWLESIAPIPSVTHQVDTILDILREEEFNADFKTVFERLQQQVSYYIGINAESEARGLVVRVKQNILDMPPGSWQQRYEAELLNRFGHLLPPPSPPSPAGVQLSQYVTDEAGPAGGDSNNGNSYLLTTGSGS